MCFIIVSVFIATLVLHVSSRKPALRIIGGSDVAEDELPYVGRIRLHLVLKNQGIVIFKERMHVCTCSMFTPNWALTAGHCITPDQITSSIEKDGVMMKYEYYIAYGPLEKNHTSQILQWYRHPGYLVKNFPFRLVNDIGLIKTEKTVLSQYGHISALDSTSMLGLEATAAGYGLMKIAGVIAPADIFEKPLQKLDVVVIKCNCVCRGVVASWKKFVRETQADHSCIPRALLVLSALDHQTHLPPANPYARMSVFVWKFYFSILSNSDKDIL
ncbi:hypothetical protein SFRURICE_002881 [Spodoptera frugiperda]|nr:hypothetical protein SFRURICE_002881 [Spodoptera frugiperda]